MPSQYPGFAESVKLDAECGTRSKKGSTSIFPIVVPSTPVGFALPSRTLNGITVITGEVQQRSAGQLFGAR